MSSVVESTEVKVAQLLPRLPAGQPLSPSVGASMSLLHRMRQEADFGYLLSGAVGGPLAVGILTPARNAMSLSAKDSASSFFGIWSKIFGRGFFGAWKGGSGPLLSAVPQFTAMGPLYLLVEDRSKAVMTQGQSVGFAMVSTSFVESLCTYSAQVNNAQLSYNATLQKIGTPEALNQVVPITKITRLMGPGFIPHVGRNVSAMAGIRCFAPHSMSALEHVPGFLRQPLAVRQVEADLVSSIGAAIISMPCNHLFSWASCTPHLRELSWPARAKESAVWIVGTYQQRGLKLVARDCAIRSCYTGWLFTIYRFVERQMVPHCA